MSGLGDVLLARGDLAGARKQYEQALALCEEIKDEDFASQIRNALAFLALVEGRFSDGEALARQAAAAFEKTNSAASGAAANAMLARNFLGQGNFTKAGAAAAQAEKLSQQAAGQTARFEAVLADSRVKAKSGKVVEARQELETMLASAHKFGYRIYEYEARLALGEIELWSGNPAAHADLTNVGADARAQGSLLVANQARALEQRRK